ncbi:Haloacid dehalogenase [Venturia nashicola]|nr:Haloacid dehalogenase [Venturia nashicola]
MPNYDQPSLGKISNILTEEYALQQDAIDPLKHLRDEFNIPSRGDLKRKRSKDNSDSSGENGLPCTYLCGNSLGLQPKRTREYIDSYLSTWSKLGVYGHFKPLEDQVTEPWVDIDDQAKDAMAKIVGASPGEVAVMQTLTANLHLLMASFYRPTKDRWKIIIEGKAFPSDHYAVYSQLAHHNLSPQDALVLIEPSDIGTHIFSTQNILDTISAHAETTALLLLPGIHYYTGQYLDIKTITSFAQSKGITVGWDLAHAAGNVPVQLHDWNVDFAAWCTYKYINAGPGSIAALFVHERHGKVNSTEEKESKYTPRLSGWWGSSKSTRFQMDNNFLPIPGAAGWQLSNPSVFDCTSVLASLNVFNMTSIQALRQKSCNLTAYLEYLLENWMLQDRLRCYSILTPSNPEERGAQLSVRLEEGLLETVMAVLEEEGVVLDERKPDVIRVAPAPLYNTHADLWRFMSVFEKALKAAKDKKSAPAVSKGEGIGGVMVDGPSKKDGWSDLI